LVIHGGLLYALRLQQTLSAAVKAGMRQSVCWAGWSRRRRSGLPLEVRRADAMMWAMLPPARQCFNQWRLGRIRRRGFLSAIQGLLLMLAKKQKRLP
jgi:hypothetical protein